MMNSRYYVAARSFGIRIVPTQLYSNYLKRTLPAPFVVQANFHAQRILCEASVSQTTATTPIGRIVPKFQITFTCKACDARTTHQMTKQAYTKGTVLIQCPSCKNRHLIADNLKIFSDSNINIEDILREKGESIEKGEIHEGDLEFLAEDVTATGPAKAIT